MSIPVVVLFGQTAIGKTELLFDLFSSFSCSSLLAGCAEIVNADSVQVYSHARVCSAIPTDSVLVSVPHNIVCCRSPFEEFSVCDFVQEADKVVPLIFKRKKMPVVAGGAAFFIKNFIYGLPSTPKSSSATRALFSERLKSEGIESLYEELKQIDSITANRLNINDEYRILRALEVYHDSGKRLSLHEIKQEARKQYNFLVIHLCRDRNNLYKRIEKRVDEMGESLLDEFVYIYDFCKENVETVNFETVPLFKSIGYREFFEISPNNPIKASFEEVLSLIKRNTKRYAKRQETFFNKISPKISIDMEAKNWYANIHQILVEFYENNL